MGRLVRVVRPGYLHHVTQRGNGGARTFFGDAHYALYGELLAENCRAAGGGRNQRTTSATFYHLERY
jgi:putative transposase